MKHSWEEPVGKTDMLKIRDFKQVNDIMKQELKLIGWKKLESILGRRDNHLFPHEFTFLIPQDPDVFSHYGDKNIKEYCWLCGVTIRKVKNSTCAGCLVAKYCTLSCQEGDWSRHRDYCMKKKASREKTMSKAREEVFIDWEKEVD